MFKTYIDYIRDNPKNYWFKRKLYGWGWTPANWQGFAVLIAYIISIILLVLIYVKIFHKNEPTLICIIPFLIVTMIFIYICYKKGETPCWQWGISKENSKILK